MDSALGRGVDVARQVVQAFMWLVAEPLAETFSTELNVSKLAGKNPFVYASLGYTNVEKWSRRAFDDRLTSSAEGVVGKFLEEVARIISGGVKPGSGVDLQIDHGLESDVELFAIQSSENTKAAGGRRSDLRAMEAAAGALRAQRRHVNKYVAVLQGRTADSVRGGVRYMSTKAFWKHISQEDDFDAKLLNACTHLTHLLGDTRADIDRVVADAISEFGDQHGGIDWEKVSNARSRRRSASKRE